MTEDNIKCSGCGWVGSGDDVLRAPSPFIPQFTIYACPRCKEIERLDHICNLPEIKNQEYYETADCSCGAVYQLQPSVVGGRAYWALTGIDTGEE